MAKILKVSEMTENRKVNFTLDEIKDKGVVFVNMEVDDDHYNGTYQAAKDLKHGDTFEFNGNEYFICDTYIKKDDQKYAYEFGYTIYKDGEVAFLISIYEPGGYQLNAKRGSVTFTGHEELITLWLDDGEWDMKYTR